MVSFWPFKGDDSSAASFERTLSQLSTKINKASAQNDGLRQHQRRFKVLWTLYTSFAYILVALILTLVTGWERWGAVEYSAIAGSPVVIFGVRTALDAYYNYRLSNSQNHLNELYKQREATIEKLKTATKYNSTQQLLDKYGGTPKKRQPSPQPKKRKSEGGQGNQTAPQGGRTGFVPPPTANIPGRQPPPGPMLPEGAPGSRPTSAGMTQPRPQTREGDEPGEEFAPNAYSAPSRPPTLRQPSVQSQYAADSPKWYDRILDVVLGEDETQSKNRIALICQNCRLVNGQAPPGVRTLEEIGKWRCSACHTMNGVESEEKKMLQQISGGPASPTSPNAVADTGSGLDGEYEEVDPDAGGSEDESTLQGTASAETTIAGSTRSKARQRKKA
ncbi:uncharacterized protein LTR77_005527 [Saxophila tyrrhenica]|uniref:Endoplasmic reticulum junction formation protein lunapark n=1 Tax=Saxophila tyrrhenica TaxID=1690608 RepID=A0AAV9PAY6_9PEZI|nr:hypothetical protein LTR77_005527 [Saxophila tyrrhenica]